jgi:hypothetical protein
MSVHTPGANQAAHDLRLGVLLTVCLVFLQEGLSYYVSFQLLALVSMGIAVMSRVKSVRLNTVSVLAFVAFVLSFVLTGILAPQVISKNSANIAVVVFGMSGYAAWIYFTPRMKLRDAHGLLATFRFAAMATILSLATLMLISETRLVPFLTRQALLAQNARLIDNFTNLEAIEADMELRALLTDKGERIDLFYGEPSFLAIVIFVCAVSFVVSARMLDRDPRRPSSRGEQSTSYKLVVWSSALMLLYLQSLSSIIYALLLTYFLVFRGLLARSRWWVNVSALLVFLLVFVSFSYDYLIYRLTMGESLSFVQRFGFLLNLGWSDLLLGIKDASVLPEFGIHNGVLYIIAVAGGGGLAFIAVLLRCVARLSAWVQLSGLLVTLMLAVMSQNGGVFMPGKVVLFSLIMVPLACGQSLLDEQQKLSEGGRVG